MATTRAGKCPLCGNDNYRSKPQMACKIMSMIKYPKEKSRYGNGNFSRFEMLALYKFIKKNTQKRKGNV